MNEKKSLRREIEDTLMVVIIYWLTLFVFVIKNGCITTAVSESYVHIYKVQQSVKQGN